MSEYCAIAPDVRLGRGVKLSRFINLYGCAVGDETKIGAFVEVQKNATIGRRCKISSHTFICEGVTIEDNVFVGHGVTFTNDTYPRATTPDGELQTEEHWEVGTTLVKRGASIGSGPRSYRIVERRNRCGRRGHSPKVNRRQLALPPSSFGITARLSRT